MSFTEKDVDYVANLSRISLSDEEKKNFTVQLEQILKYVEKLNRLNTDNIEPTAHILPVSNVFRDDVAKICPTTRFAVEQSALLVDGLFGVPRVI
ncbi:Asp-tRNA(Asn)/Glu-tRNA(Gln) amidotransferase subunit GatC [bacterium]|nr:Asp-tRNA(Asn)/Glu-tRNA(Gln) amidotransferase subunit GatC [bacterium]